MINRKSQAALEFLMTYGWAILVVLVAVGALAYFGVLDPGKFLPPKCIFQGGITCLDHKATAASLQVVLQNSLGSDITIDGIKADQCTALGSQGTLANGAKLGPVTLTCTNSGSKYNGVLNITYTTPETGIQHTNKGQVTTRIE